MGVIVEAVEEFLDALMNKSVMSDVIGPIVELSACGKVAVKNQVGGFEIGALLRQLLDGISAIAQDAFVAVNEGDAADAGRGVQKGGIVAHQAKIGVLN